MQPFIVTFCFELMTKNLGAATFEELMARTGWGVSPPEIDLDHLRDEFNLPEADTGKCIFEEVGFTEWQKSSESRVLWFVVGLERERPCWPSVPPQNFSKNSMIFLTGLS